MILDILLMILIFSGRRIIMRTYKKPVLKAQKKNSFVFDVIKAHVKGTFTCKQCSSCHGCRG